MSEAFKLLVVDDDIDVLESLAADLEDGYTVTSANNPHDALKLLGKQRFDVLVTDVRMPGMSGIELAKKAREQDPNLPSVFVSAYSDPPDTQAIIDTPGAFKVAKPWHDTLTVAIERALEYRQNLNQSNHPHKGRATQRMALLGLRAAGMAHDLRSPLMVVQASIDLARMNLQLVRDSLAHIAASPGWDHRSVRELIELIEGDEGFGALDEAETATETIANVVASTMAVVRNEQVNKEACSAKMAADRARLETRRRFHKPVTVALEPDLFVAISEVDLVRVFVNLLENAAAASHGSAQVTISSHEFDAAVFITVADDGPGLPSAWSKKGAVETTHDAKHRRLQLGLTICQDLLNEAGGKLDISDTTANGTCFTIHLRRA